MIDFIYAGEQLHKAAQEKNLDLVGWVLLSAGHGCNFVSVGIQDWNVLDESAGEGCHKFIHYESLGLEGEDWEKKWVEAIKRTYAALDAYQPEKKEDEK